MTGKGGSRATLAYVRRRSTANKHTGLSCRLDKFASRVFCRSVSIQYLQTGLMRIAMARAAFGPIDIGKPLLGILDGCNFHYVRAKSYRDGL